MARGSKKRKRKLLIAIVVIVLIAAIALGVLYAVRPDIFDAIVSMFVPEKPDETESPTYPRCPTTRLSQATFCPCACST